jgi:hypothetical protein
MAASFTMPRGDYRKFPFRLSLCKVAQDIQGYTFYFTWKAAVYEPDADILFDKTVAIPSGTPVYSSYFEVLPEDSDLTPATYWMEATAMLGVDKPVTAPPAPFIITERLRKDF